MKTKYDGHTPGPWFHYDFDSPSPHGRPYVVAMTTNDASVVRGYTVTCGQHNPKAGTYWPASGVGGRSSEEARSNARLIADSPKLLAAMVKIIEAKQAAFDKPTDEIESDIANLVNAIDEARKLIQAD